MQTVTRSDESTRVIPLAVDAKQLASMLGVSLRAIRALDASGKLPRPVTIGMRSIRWPVSEIEGWLKAGAPDRSVWEALKRNGPAVHR